MDYHETKQVLIYLHADSGKAPSDSKIKVWADICRPVPVELGMMAARRMLRTTKTFGEPKMVDYREHVNALCRAVKDLAAGRTYEVGAAQLSRCDTDTRLKLEARRDVIKEISQVMVPEQAKLLVSKFGESLPTRSKERKNVRDVNRARKMVPSNTESHHVVQMALGKPTPKPTNEDDEIISGSDDGRYIRRSEIV